jgi:hypothetical protein
MLPRTAGELPLLEEAADLLGKALRPRLLDQPGEQGGLEADGEADKKTDTSKKKTRRFPRGHRLLDLAEKIREGREKGLSQIDVAREFMDEDEPKAQSALRTLRRYPRLLK